MPHVTIVSKKRKEEKKNVKKSTKEASSEVRKETVETRTTKRTTEEYRVVELNNIPVGQGANKVTAEVTMPSGAKAVPSVLDNQDGTVTVRYDPCETGLHVLDLIYENKHIQGSPFQFYVESAKAGKVYAYGPGLIQGMSEETCQFTVVTKDAGPGSLSMAVEGPSKVELKCVDNKDGTVGASYLPTLPGDYEIVVKFGGKPIVGSPFLAKIGGTRKGGSGVQESSSMVMESFSKTYSSSSFTASMPKFNSDASKVTSHGMGLKKAFLHKENTFNVNCKNAGNNMLMVGVYGPSHPCEQVNIKHTGHQQYAVSYVVKDKGDYILVVKWGDEHIPGSPFHITV